MFSSPYHRSLLKDCRPNDKDNDTWAQRQPPKKKDSQQSLQSSAGPPGEQRLVEQHLARLQQRLARAAGGSKLRTVTVSASSGQVKSLTD